MKFKPRSLRSPQLDAAHAITTEVVALIKAATPPKKRPPGGFPPKFRRKRRPVPAHGGYSLWDGAPTQPGERVARMTVECDKPRRTAYYVIPAADVDDPYAWSAAGYSYVGPVLNPNDEPEEARRRQLAAGLRFRVKQLTDDERTFEKAAWPAYRRCGLIGFDLDPTEGATEEALDFAAGEVLAWLGTQDIEARVSTSGNGRHVEVNVAEDAHHPELFRIFLGMLNRMAEAIGPLPLGVRLDPSVLNVGSNSRGRIWRIPGGLAKDGVSRKEWTSGVRHPRPVTAAQLLPYRITVERRARRAERKIGQARRRAKTIQGTFKPLNMAACDPLTKELAGLWSRNAAGTPDRQRARLAIAGAMTECGWPVANVARVVNDATKTSEPRHGNRCAETTRDRFLAGATIVGADWLEKHWKIDLRAVIALAMPKVETKATSAPAKPWDRIGYMRHPLKRRLWHAGQALLCACADDTAGRHFREVAGCGAISSRIDCDACNGVRSYQRKACKRPCCAACWPALVSGFREAVESADYAETWPEQVYVAHTHIFHDYDELVRACGRALGGISGLRWKHHYAITLQGPKPLEDLGPAPGMRYLLVADPRLRSGNNALGWLNGTVDSRADNLGVRPVAEEWRLVSRAEAMDLVAMAQLTHYTARAKMLRNGWMGELAESLHQVHRRTFAAGSRDNFCVWPSRKDAEAQVIAACEAERNEADDEPLALPVGRHECPGCAGADVHHCLLYGHGPVEERTVIHRNDYPHSMGQAMKLTLEHARLVAPPGQPVAWVPWPPRRNPLPTQPG